MNLAIVRYNVKLPLVTNVLDFTVLSQDTLEHNVLINLLWVNDEKGITHPPFHMNLLLQ